MGVPSALVDEDGNPIPGMVPDDEIREHPDRHSQAVMKDFYRTSEFCAACHKANLPDTAQRLQIHPRLHRLRRVAEFQILPAQSADLLSRPDFTTCQDCHMQRDATHARRLRRQARHAGLPSLARWQYRRAFLLRL